jgi:hypothetical protein
LPTGNYHLRDGYIDQMQIFLKHKDKFLPPYTIEDDVYKYEWPNTSFMRFGSQKLKDEYIRQYEYHKNILSGEDFKIWPDVIIEQMHMGKLLKTGYSSRPLVYGFPSKGTNQYSYIIGFCHLGSDKIALKDETFLCLKKLNTDLYEETLKMIEKFNAIYKEKTAR